MAAPHSEKSGNKTPLLGFGTMRYPMLDAEKKIIDTDQVKKMVDEYMAAGMNYFDTAYMYHEGRSECILKEAVTDRYPRASFTVADKLPMWPVESEADLEKIFRTQLERTGLDYFDFYLIHAVNKEIYEKCKKFGAFDFMKRLKAEGRAKHIGFSFHDSPEFLESFLDETSDFLEFVQLQINYLDWTDETRSKELYDIARKYNKPIIIMEPVKGGTLANVPDEAMKLLKAGNPEASAASWALRYCATLPGIMTILSGMSSLDQMRDNVDTISNFKPVSPEENEILDKAVVILKKAAEIPCTSCRYCIDCPMMIDIPQNFTVYNNFKRSLDNENAAEEYRKANPANEAAQCIACGRCEEVCPQSIKIIDKLKRISKKFSK